MKTNLPTTALQIGNLLKGQWVYDSKVSEGSKDKFNVLSPYNGQVIGQVSEASSQEIQEALAFADQAQRTWAQTPIKERSQVLFRLREILLSRKDEITHIKCSESGKTFSEGKAGLMKGIEVLEFALSIQNLDLGGKVEVSKGVTCEYRREPIGVVLNITPFNFPAMVPMWTMPIAIALGNAYVWKPSHRTPLTSKLIAQCWMDAGLPAGILTVVQGGVQVVEQLIDSPLVKAVGFVGSTPVAKKVFVRASQLGKRSLALGGAKNHILLFPDANPELSGMGISDSFTGCAGQRCMAASVLLAVGDVQSHIEKVVARAKSLVLGESMGAIISKEQKEFLNEAITRAEKSGARILLDGRNSSPPKGLEGGNWLGPTILDQVQPGSEAATVELFGPVLSIIRCKDLSEALKIQASNEYGNACSVFTNSGSIADRVVREAKAGMVGVNVGVPVPREPFSFGGVQASKFGHGDITGQASLDLWSNLKKVTTKWEKQESSSWMG